MRAIVYALLALTLASYASSIQSMPTAGMRAGSTADYFKSACERDGGALWGVSLCGPLIIADPETRMVWASQADIDGALSEKDGVWTGKLPAGVPIANTAVTWAGAEWVMLIAPLPDDRMDRQVLVMHEAWHRIQDEIGISALPADARHLETEEARTLLRLEMRALAEALEGTGADRDRAVSDALAFRAERVAISQNAWASEDALDRNEGLASYTGVVLGAGNDAVGYAVKTLEAYDQHDAYTRTYAYATGPAYGLLLDKYAPNWRSSLGESSPAAHLFDHIPQTAGQEPLEARSARYGADEIREAEQERSERRASELQALRDQYTSAPRLVLPLREMQFEFDPNAIVPLEGLGSVYGGLTLRDRWGELVALGGALISEDFTRLIVVRPDPSGLTGDGWSLNLAEGYTVDLSPTSGDFELVN